MKKEYYRNENLSLSAAFVSAIPLSNLAHFYTILDTFMRSLLLYDLTILIQSFPKFYQMFTMECAFYSELCKGFIIL